jgi:GT2 family glycosyltransferase
MTPEIAVVAATHNRAHLVPRLIAALERQTIDVPFEVLIVDDASTDDTVEVLTKLAASSPLNLRILRQERNAGPATARNRGWQEATAKLIAFTDDDCVPQPGWLASLRDALAHHDLVQGLTEPDPEQLANFQAFGHTIHVISEAGYYETCNMGYRREVLARVGGFDEGFAMPYGEDTDLAWRAKFSGASSTFAPTAVVWHDATNPGYLAHLKEMRRREGLVMAIGRNDDLRRQLKLGWWFSASHPPAIILFALMLVLPFRARHPSTWALGLGAGVWYALACRSNTFGARRKVDWLRILPLRLIGDFYEISILARASVRHRTFLL